MGQPKLVGRIGDTDLSQAAAIVPISVGSPDFEGERLASILELVKSQFGRVVIVITGDLQRFNLAKEHFNNTGEEKDPELFRDQARRKGEEWLARNQAVIDEKFGSKEQEGFKYEVRRWAADHSEEPFKDLLKNEDSSFAKAFEKSVAKFLARPRQKGSAVCLQVVDMTKRYMLEETEAVVRWGNDSDLAEAFLIYPHPLHEVMYNAIQTQVRDPEHPNRMRHLKISFEMQEQVITVHGGDREKSPDGSDKFATVYRQAPNLLSGQKLTIYAAAHGDASTVEDLTENEMVAKIRFLEVSLRKMRRNGDHLEIVAEADAYFSKLMVRLLSLNATKVEYHNQQRNGDDSAPVSLPSLTSSSSS